ncbi:MAG: hypothetical protein IPM55_02440 [Acidobacteria bacterium]|nr:hypothetical protein [Acidobacteriota bacterium]
MTNIAIAIDQGEDTQALLAEYKAELDGIPARIRSAETRALSGPADGIEAALTEKKELLARVEALDILIFRAEESLINVEIRKAQERLKPLADQIAEAEQVEEEAQASFAEARTKFEDAQARRRQLEHDQQSLSRELEKQTHAFYQHRNGTRGNKPMSEEKKKFQAKYH